MLEFLKRNLKRVNYALLSLELYKNKFRNIAPPGCSWEGEGVMQPSQAAGSKERQGGQQYEYFK
jgi:hypothetical protein